MKQEQKRVYFIDYLRAAIVLIVVMDHSAQGYAQRFGRHWFLPDPDRSAIMDIIHMFDFSFMMPFLFFLSGMFVISSLYRRGFVHFIRDKIIRLLVPVAIGLPIIVPLLTYPRYILQKNGTLGYIDYLSQVFFKWDGDIQIALFWFLLYLFTLCLVTAILYSIFPKFYNIFGRFMKWCFEQKPLMGIVIISTINGILISGSDIYWGAMMWPGFPPFFVVPGAHMLVIIFFFLLGIGAGIQGLPNQWFQKIANNLISITIVMAILGVTYIGYSLSYFDETYDMKLLLYIYYGGAWENATPILEELVPYILPRTLLRGFFMTFQCLFFLGLFFKYINKADSKLWQSLAFCSYGIYIFHEPFSVWMNYLMYYSNLPALIKFILTTTISVSCAWAITHQIKKIAIVRKVI